MTHKKSSIEEMQRKTELANQLLVFVGNCG